MFHAYIVHMYYTYTYMHYPSSDMYVCRIGMFGCVFSYISATCDGVNLFGASRATSGGQLPDTKRA